MRLLSGFCALSLLPALAWAEVPKVAVDIAPLHSLVVQVMDGLGTPELLIPANASPHDASLRPSDAARLQEAQVIFMVDEALTPWLPPRIEALSSAANVVALLERAPVQRAYAEEEGHDDHEDHAEHGDHDAHDDHGDHEAHKDHDDHGDHEAHKDHDDHGDHAQEHGHDDHDDHDDHAKHEDHADEAAHAGHNHGDTDPHAWLNPENAAAWVHEIARVLGEADPQNALRYRENADAAAISVLDLAKRIGAKLDGHKGMSYIAYHDAYGYFGDAWGIESLGSLTSNEGGSPSVQDLRNLEHMVEHGEIGCVLTEVQFNSDAVEQVVSGHNAVVVMVDPLGAAHDPGAGLYIAVLEDLADAMASCPASSRG
jgi:zinc transport system substrate-binding protein